MPIELLGAHEDENGLMRLPSHRTLAEVSRVLGKEGLNREERIAAMPWYAANSGEDEWFPEAGRRVLHSVVALELDISPRTAKGITEAAESHGFIEIKRAGKTQRPVSMRATDDGLHYLEENPELATNVSIFVAHKKREFAKQLWHEVSCRHRALGRAPDEYQGEAITTLLGLNAYIAGLQVEQEITLGALDAQDAQKARL